MRRPMGQILHPFLHPRRFNLSWSDLRDSAALESGLGVGNRWSRSTQRRGRREPTEVWNQANGERPEARLAYELTEARRLKALIQLGHHDRGYFRSSNPVPAYLRSRLRIVHRGLNDNPSSFGNYAETASSSYGTGGGLARHDRDLVPAFLRSRLQIMHSRLNDKVVQLREPPNQRG